MSRSCSYYSLLTSLGLSDGILGLRSLLRLRGLLDALVKIGRNEGVLAYWKGFAPYFLRLGNHTAFTFLFLEELKKLW
jgi:hypothetical protein